MNLIFDYDLSKLSSSELLGHMTGHTQVVKEPAHIWIPNRPCLCKECFVSGVSYKGHCSRQTFLIMIL